MKSHILIYLLYISYYLFQNIFLYFKEFTKIKEKKGNTHISSDFIKMILLNGIE